MFLITSLSLFASCRRVDRVCSIDSNWKGFSVHSADTLANRVVFLCRLEFTTHSEHTFIIRVLVALYSPFERDRATSVFMAGAMCPVDLCACQSRADDEVEFFFSSDTHTSVSFVTSCPGHVLST